MNVPRLARLETEITALPDEEQLWLLEWLAHQLRLKAGPDPGVDRQLAAMAEDPEIRSELRAIDDEFRSTEMDGLGRL
ncbi:MAG TPA: hypothetical protein VGG06_06710 [Thermoanaerobaculia bacterium]|jgi:hypothetical protein